MYLCIYVWMVAVKWMDKSRWVCTDVVKLINKSRWVSTKGEGIDGIMNCGRMEPGSHGHRRKTRNLQLVAGLSMSLKGTD